MVQALELEMGGGSRGRSPRKFLAQKPCSELSRERFLVQCELAVARTLELEKGGAQGAKPSEIF